MFILCSGLLISDDGWCGEWRAVRRVHGVLFQAHSLWNIVGNVVAAVAKFIQQLLAFEFRQLHFNSTKHESDCEKKLRARWSQMWQKQLVMYFDVEADIKRQK